MLKRKRKINKQVLIATSRRYQGPFPLAYGALLKAGTLPQLALAMVTELQDGVPHGKDSGDLWGVCVWSDTPYCEDWRKAAVV